MSSQKCCRRWYHLTPDRFFMGLLEHLKRLTNLKWLVLYGTNVTDEGVEGLEQALPECTIRH